MEPRKIVPSKIFRLLKHLKSNLKIFSKYWVVSYNIKLFLVYPLFQVVIDNLKSNPKIFSKYWVVSYNIKSFLVYPLFQVVIDNIKSNPKKF